MTDLSDILLRRSICEVCGVRKATQLHHCIVHDSKRYHKELTVPENLMPVCEHCHTTTQRANSKAVRVKFAHEQIRRGYDVAGWYKSLPLKSKEAWILEL